MDITLSPIIAILVPVVIAVVAIMKNYIPSAYAPLMALSFGIGGSFLFPQVSWQASLVVGIIVGATASGFYSQGKAVVS